MRVVSGVSLLLLCLHSLQGQGLDPGLVPGPCDEQVAQALRQKVPDTLRDIILLYLKSVEARVKDSEDKVNDMRVELAATKTHVVQLQKENAGKTSFRLHFKSVPVMNRDKKSNIVDLRVRVLFVLHKTSCRGE